MPSDPPELSLESAIAWRSASMEAARASTLADRAQPDETADRRPRALGQPLTGGSDPRWVLALRTAESMEGAIVRPEQREKLLRLGRMLGLSPFDSNLVVAIVQDQARRGYAPSHCPLAGEKQLTMVPLPDAHLPGSMQSRRRRLRRAITVATAITSFLAAEAFLVWWMFF